MYFNNFYNDYSKIYELAEKNQEKFQNAFPYPHIVFDHFLIEEKAKDILNVFPSLNDIPYYEYNNPLERKYAMDKINIFPIQIQNCLLEFNSPNFLKFLEILTGFQGLISDPYLRGGGIHQSKYNGKLDIHIDFNIHPLLKLHRKLNVILFLNINWEEFYNGDLQIWEGKQHNNQHKLIKLYKKIYPIFNRLVIFETSEKSYHGFPEPIQCPKGMTRKSLAWYYFLAPDQALKPHSTTFVKLPNEDDSLEGLRQQRNIKRITTNIANN